jgi:AcrR family transcriptional regulator
MPRRVRDPQSKEHLVAAAWRLVAESGPSATTLRAVAAEAGVTTGSVTHYFTDKAELMAEVQRYNGTLAANRVLAAVGDRRALAAAQQATLALLPLDQERVTCWRVWLAFWSQEPPQRPTDGGFAQGYRAWSALIRRYLAEAIEDGELPPGLDLRHEIGLLGTLVAGTGLLAGSDLATRSQLRERAKQIFTEHFETLAGRVGVATSRVEHG